MFPSEIVTTSRRPDIIIYSPSEEQGIFIELNMLRRTLHRPTLGKKWSMEIWFRKDKVQDGNWNISL